MPKLLIKKGAQLVKKVSVPENILAFTVGSEQGNDIILQDERISFFHLQFEKQGDEYYVRDLQSQHGTYVNGQRITERTFLRHNDVISIGHHTLQFLHPINGLEAPSDLSRQNVQPSLQATENLLDRVKGVPSLNNLNSWVTREHNSAGDNGSVRMAAEPIPAAEAVPQARAAELEVEAPPVPHQPVSQPSREPVAQPLPSAPVVAPAPEPELPELPSQPEPPLVEARLNFATPPVESEPRVEPAPAPQSTETAQVAPEIEIPPPPEPYYLLGIYGYYLGKRFPIRTPETRIGRDRRLNDIVIKRNARGKIDPSVSRRHATIRFKKNRYVISDRKSKSRTYVNQLKLDPDDEVTLRPGDEIEIVSDRKSHIFRVVREGDWDFSFPKKAGLWHVRYRTKIVNLYSAVLVLLALLFFARSFHASRIISERPEPLRVDTQPWFDFRQQADGVTDSAGELATFPAVADFNRDGHLDVVYADPQGTLTSVDGRTQETLWTVEDFKVFPNLPVAVTDLNQDGKPDVVAVAQDHRLRTIDGLWGIEIWKGPILQGPLFGPPAVGDFNRDGLKDLAITSQSGSVYIGYSSLVSSRWIKVELNEPTQGVTSVARLGTNPTPMLLVGTETGKVLFVDGELEKVTSELNIDEELNKATGSFVQQNQIRHPVASGDLTGDGFPDLVVYTVQGNLIAFDGLRHTRLWYAQAEEPGEVPTPFAGGVGLGDLDGDQAADVVLLSPTGQLIAFKGAGLARDRKMELWRNTEHRFHGAPALADFNKNGTADVLVSDQLGRLFIFEGASGELLWRQMERREPVAGAPLIADLDGDYALDILLARTSGRFYRHATNSRHYQKPILWQQMFGSAQNNSGLTATPLSARKYHLNMLISVVLVVLTGASQFWFRYKRRKLAYSLG